VGGGGGRKLNAARLAPSIRKYKFFEAAAELVIAKGRGINSTSGPPPVLREDRVKDDAQKKSINLGWFLLAGDGSAERGTGEGKESRYLLYSGGGEFGLAAR